MGGSQSQNQNRYSTGTSSTEVTGIAPYQEQFARGYSSLANLFGSRVNQPLNLETAPIFSGTLDPVVQNTISQGVQNIKAQQAQQGRGTARQLSVAGTGNNSALLSALNRQSQIASGGALNQLPAIGLEQQRAFDLQRQAAIQARNQEAMAARAQLVNELQPGMNLLQLLNQMAQTSAGKRTRESKTEESAGSSSRSFF